MSTISTGTTLTTAFVVEGDTTGSFVVKTGAGAGTTAMTIDASQNATFANPVTFSGAVVAPAGTVSAPGITTTSNTNTGIFFPAADTIAFAEGGTEALRINSSGNVGIGTNNPLRRLDISGGGMAFTEAGGSTRNIHWGDTTNIYPVTINGVATSGNCYFSINTNTFGNAAVERLRVGPAGQLGIGGANYGTAGQVLTSNGAAAAPTWAAPAGLPTMNIVSGTTQAATANNHYVLTNTSATTVTLPASPAAGDVVWVTVGNGRVDNVIARNGQKINNISEDMTINNAYAGIQLRYANATIGWIFT